MWLPEGQKTLFQVMCDHDKEPQEPEKTTAEPATTELSMQSE